MSDASWPLQQAVYAHLATDAGLRTLIGDTARIYDAVPPGAIFPYLTLGEARVRDWDGVPGGQEHDLRLHAFSRHGGRAEIKQIMSAVHDALQDAALFVPTFSLVSLRYIFGDTWRRADNETWQGTMRYRATTHPVDLTQGEFA